MPTINTTPTGTMPHLSQARSGTTARIAWAAIASTVPQANTVSPCRPSNRSQPPARDAAIRRTTSSELATYTSASTCSSRGSAR